MSDIQQKLKALYPRLLARFPGWQIETRIAFFDDVHVYFTWGKGTRTASARLGMQVDQLEDEALFTAWVEHARAVLALVQMNGELVATFFKSDGERQSAESDW